MQTRHELEWHLTKNNYLLLTINVTNNRQHHAFFQRFLCHKCSQQCQHWKFMKLFVVYKMILFSICLWYKLSLYKLLSLVKLPLLVQLKVYIISYSLNRFSEIESFFFIIIIIIINNNKQIIITIIIIYLNIIIIFK